MSAGFVPQQAFAGSATLRETVEKVVNTNPEIRAKFHVFRDVYEEQGVANGGYWPKVDIVAGIGREKRDGEHIQSTNYLRRSGRIELSQMLFDGFYTRNQMSRLKHSGQGRYLEFLNAMENVGLESVGAYADVLRYREMVRLAKRNYDYHQEIYNQVRSRVDAGVGAVVDLDQISARVALAQSNYLTEVSNLHDVTSRYQRLVGELPPEELAAPVLNVEGIPRTAKEALMEAFQHNPGFLATLSDTNAARQAIKVQQSKFYPRLDLKAYRDWSRNTTGVEGLQNDSVVELALTFNIFNGGSDAAAEHQYRQKMYVAVDLKDKAASDLRQVVSIAYNDRIKIGEQVHFLDVNRKSLDKVRVAYRQQFNIGKRTLLDLLDTENEYYQSQRAYYNAYFDLTGANARVLAGMGKLLSAIGVVRGEMPSLKDINIPMPQVTSGDIPAVETPVGSQDGAIR